MLLTFLSAVERERWVWCFSVCRSAVRVVKAATFWDSRQHRVVLTAASLRVPVPDKEYLLPGSRCVFLGGTFSIPKVEVPLSSVGVRAVLAGQEVGWCG